MPGKIYREDRVYREQLKSKIHRAIVTDANVDYEGNITIPADLMAAVDIWEREKVLVASITSGARLETYVQKGPEGSGQITINGGAALRIKAGERISILCFALAETPVLSRLVLCNDKNEIIRRHAAQAVPGY